MSENVYWVNKKCIRFSESHDEFGCLCTFPYQDQESLGPDRIVSLALFGAVVRLIFDGFYDDRVYRTIFIPQDVPTWILRDMEKLAKSLTSGKDEAASQAEADRGTLPGVLLEGWLNERGEKSQT